MRDHDVTHLRPVDEVVRSLARLPVGRRLVLSLTLPVRFRDEMQRERVRLFVKEELRRVRPRLAGAPFAEEIERDIARLEELVEDYIKRPNDHGDVGGLALYLASGAGLEMEIQTEQPLPESLTLAPWPTLRPLLRVVGDEEQASALVVVTVSGEVRLYQLAPTGTTLAMDVHRDVERRHKRGGWSQLHFQHHRQEQLDHLHRDAAAEIVKAFDAGGRVWVLLGGRVEARSNLLKFLPPRVQTRLVDVPELDPAMPEPRLAEVAEGALSDLLLEESVARVHVLEEKQATGLAKLGARAVAEATNYGQLGHLYLGQRFEEQGLVCRNCGTVDLVEPMERVGSCRQCNSDVDVGDLGEILARKAVLQSAPVTILDGPTGLDAHGSIAAELRFPTVH